MTLQKLFKTKKNWCQGASARSATGRAVKVDSPRAVAWCLGGALELCYHHDMRPDKKLSKVIKTNLFSNWNDDPKRKFSEVKRLVKELNL